MPPQAGFVSEWYLFQTFFQGFHLGNLDEPPRGRARRRRPGADRRNRARDLYQGVRIGPSRKTRSEAAKPVPEGTALAVGALGLLVLALAVGMPVWLGALSTVDLATFGADAAGQMRDGWLLVPLTAKFAFISPSKLVIAMPLLALLPITLLVLTMRKKASRVPVWYGGRSLNPERATTTGLTFSNALRTFYSFVYRPTVTTERQQAEEGNGHPYFIRRLVFTHDVAPIFGPYLFVPLERLASSVARRMRVIQSGHLNVYLALVGVLLIVILFISLL